MSTVAKALSVLETLADMPGEPGLTQIARAVQLDKATTHRMLVELEKFGFIEQEVTTRCYRLGNAPVRLAHIRESRYPFLDVVLPQIRRLAAETNETVHLSRFISGRLATVHVTESTHANRVTIPSGAILPLHATASGIAFLSALPMAERNALLGDALETFTAQTVVSRTILEQTIRDAVERGYSASQSGFDLGVSSVAAPILDNRNHPIGTVAVACPETRMSPREIEKYGAMVAQTARDVTRAYWGTKQKAG
ncbi:MULTISPECIES: IclR family transcriptional regulator [unclassified Rhizobium]|uniref:IclR family transcriptional regulator n=1 Tax=unclassified Rhizobium TaxID=2613769 RepID=UPI0016165781|nr:MULTISPECIES: IclR family transcriptional regulator [unclassified Rhizobium]MBB3289054.1 DNA-binding IclR family transcriptional regulator [Rhizobium sp. BK252]MBB3403796.1 DNA-binding IclR family transcriptional regulator [Rhizobium sp. BK289]MBB3416535.1 DNA-binding IclR family transcriptional regulator [Rhizobium sp. BK284]MBB3484259.1 DNA-binding IclR family transcriptional regulator [Rhizobium sp. BK347]